MNPNYYDKLLKEYSFSGKTDLEIFIADLQDFSLKKDLNVLELGCGTGRGTEVILGNLDMHKLTLVDLSKDMIEKTKERFGKYRNVEYVQSDTLNYLKNTNDKFDLAFSLWSYSHSVYQLIERVGLEKGLQEVRKIITKLFNENMKNGSRFFLIHSDWLSDEQKILIKQWGREVPNLYKYGKQGISKLTLDSVFEDLSKKRLINYTITHYQGDPIEYGSLEEALETFINFHLESYFNDTKYIYDVFSDLRDYLLKFQDKDGKVQVRPACFIYRCTKL